MWSTFLAWTNVFGVVQEVLVYLKISTHFKSLGITKVQKKVQSSLLFYGVWFTMALLYCKGCVWIMAFLGPWILTSPVVVYGVCSNCPPSVFTTIRAHFHLSPISRWRLFFPPLCACPCMEWRFRGSYNRQASNPNALNFALQCNAFKRITLSSSVSHLCVLFRLQCILYFELHFEKCQTAVVSSLFGGVSINSYFTCYLDEVWYE